MINKLWQYYDKTSHTIKLLNEGYDAIDEGVNFIYFIIGFTAYKKKSPYKSYFDSTFSAWSIYSTEPGQCEGAIPC